MCVFKTHLFNLKVNHPALSSNVMISVQELIKSTSLETAVGKAIRGRTATLSYVG